MKTRVCVCELPECLRWYRAELLCVSACVCKCVCVSVWVCGWVRENACECVCMLACVRCAKGEARRRERETSLEGKGMGYLRRCSGVHVM